MRLLSSFVFPKLANSFYILHPYFANSVLLRSSSISTHWHIALLLHDYIVCHANGDTGVCRQESGLCQILVCSRAGLTMGSKLCAAYGQNATERFQKKQRSTTVSSVFHLLLLLLIRSWWKLIRKYPQAASLQLCPTWFSGYPQSPWSSSAFQLLPTFLIKNVHKKINNRTCNRTEDQEPRRRQHFMQIFFIRIAAASPP